MGRDLQKKKRRSGRQPVRQSNRTKKVLNPRGNTIVAQNWDKKETMVQNYRRLGLVSRLKAPTGGTEKKLHAALGARSATRRDPLAITNNEKAIVTEARVERDAEGRIVRVLGRSRRDNPLNDPLNEMDTDEDEGDDDDGAEEWGGIEAGDEEEEEPTEVVKSLLEASRNPAPKTPRHQSGREREWLERLVARHGDDTAAMARDHRLNPMQQTAADIARRIKNMGA